ncbi:MAG: CueP family metal-binding protein [Deltaproteobacteria bacterium]|nr:MAG: CueP family metal-binding protein [Deltaproteobacteria bacterium]
MSSCQGELVQKEFNVKAVDQEGNVLVNETISTLRNGFFELWLPRNRRIELQIRGLNRKAQGTIETFEDSKTCITTFQLR